VWLGNGLACSAPGCNGTACGLFLNSCNCKIGKNNLGLIALLQILTTRSCFFCCVLLIALTLLASFTACLTSLCVQDSTVRDSRLAPTLIPAPDRLTSVVSTASSNGVDQFVLIDWFSGEHLERSINGTLTNFNVARVGSDREDQASRQSSKERCREEDVEAHLV